jgi:hypothetical protein
MKTYWGSGGIVPRIVDLGTRWRWVVSFTLRPLYPHGKSPWYPLDRRLGGSQSRSGRSGKEGNSKPLPGLEPPDHPPRSPALYHWPIPAPNFGSNWPIFIKACGKFRKSVSWTRSLKEYKISLMQCGKPSRQYDLWHAVNFPSGMTKKYTKPSGMVIRHGLGSCTVFSLSGSETTCNSFVIYGLLTTSK